jgi:uncharacterized protein YfbU (UPF0304 family)
MTESDRESKVAAIVQKLDKTPGHELAATAIRAAVDVIPIVGGSLSTLIEQMIPDWKFKRLSTFVAYLSVDIESVKERIQLDYLKKEEFGFLFEQTFRAVLENYQVEKLDALKNVLVNSMVSADVNQEMKEYILGLVGRLESLHMRFVSLLEDPTNYYKTHGVQDEISQVVIGGSRMQELRKCFTAMTDESIRAVWNDLYNYALVSIDARNLGVMISDRGSRALTGLLTEFGKLFVRFIRLPK